MRAIIDDRGRRIDYARISVTDRCNYRCVYCMPEEGVCSLAHEEVMRYEDIHFLCATLTELGVRKFRFTGGEPLVRKGIVSFLCSFHRDFPDTVLSLTTNASLLARYAKGLAEAGLASMNVSLDTVDPDKFRKITRLGNLEDVTTGIATAHAAGIPNIKTNTVLIRGFNDEELPDILAYAWNCGVTPRLIEFMPLGDDVWRSEKFIGVNEILELLRRYGDWIPEVPSNVAIAPMGPAKYYVNVRNGRRVGVIAAVSDHFCAQCNRLRVTATGAMRACLFNENEVSLRELVRARDSTRLKDAIVDGIRLKPDCWEDTRDGKAHMSKVGG